MIANAAKRKTAGLLLLAALAFAGGATASAAPMRCSNLLQACIAGCGSGPNHPNAAVCITNCRSYHALCARSGCWIAGGSRLCGLSRQ